VSKKVQKKGASPVRPSAVATDSAFDWGKHGIWIATGLAFFVFAFCLRNAMTGIDDHVSTVQNPAVAEFSWEKLSSGFNLGMYAPLTWLCYALAYAIGGENPFWFHLLSLIVHVANTALVYRLLQKLELRPGIVLPVAILFAIHPIQVESVAWIAGFSTPLYSMFCLLSFLFYLDYAADRPGRYRFYALALAMFVLGCLAKSAAVTVPLTLVVLDWWRRPQNLGRVQQWAAYAPFFLIALGFGLLTIHSRQSSGMAVGATDNGFSLLERAMLVCYTPIFYWAKMLLPAKLNIYYSFEKGPDGLPWYYYAAPLLLAATGYAAWRYRRQAPYIWQGLLFFFSCVVVTLPFASLSTFELRADHYNYLPCIGFFYLLVCAWGHFRSAYPQLGFLRPLGSGWILLMGILCLLQIRVWKDGITVLSNAIDNGYYQKGMMYFARGVAYGDAGRPMDGLPDFSRALEIDPDMRDAYRFRGSINAQAGRLDEALADLRKYVSYDAEHAVTWYNLGQIYLRKNQLPEALDAFTKTIALKPEAPSGYANRAKVYELMGDRERMLADQQKAQALGANKNAPAQPR
jgi:tetratricopeptide (TPR) repeat protein